jgi:hypothetical protein
MSTGGRLEGFTLFLQFFGFKKITKILKNRKNHPPPAPEYYVCLYRMIGKTAYGV